jgi:hypothetical protein
MAEHNAETLFSTMQQSSLLRCMKQWLHDEVGSPDAAGSWLLPCGGMLDLRAANGNQLTDGTGVVIRTQ